MGSTSRRAPTVAVIARLAGAQHGVVARRQLLAHGLSAKQVGTRVRAGLLVPLHRGVYAVGHPRLTRWGLRTAAVLAAGPDAALSHREAALMHGLRGSGPARIEVTTSADVRSTVAFRVFARRALAAEDVAVVAGIRVTTVARTLVDLAELLAPDPLQRALAAAERLGRLDVPTLEAALRRTVGRPGKGYQRLRAVLDEHGREGTQLTRSELEARFHAIMRAHGLPRPRMNMRIDGVEVDAVWPSQGLAVELDGWAFHRDRAAFRRDRAKGNHLELHGWRVLRYTHGDVVHDAARIARELRAALAHAAPGAAAAPLAPRPPRRGA